MDISGARDPVLEAVAGQSALVAESKVIGPVNQVISAAAATRRRRRVDALYVLGLVASLGAFWLVGRDVLVIRSGADKAINSRSSRAPPGPGSFPAPPQAGAWAEAMERCARPGPRTQSFVESFKGTPSQRIARIYIWIAQHWEYRADRDQDWLTPAETLLQPGMLRGDCKAIAILLAASSAQLGIATRMVATRGLDGQAGHVQAQVLLCRPGEDPTPVVDTMTAVWSSLGQTSDDGKADLPLILTSQGWFMSLDGGPPPRRIDRLGPVEVIVASASRINER